MRTLILSDLHLGSRNCHATEILEENTQVVAEHGVGAIRFQCGAIDPLGLLETPVLVQQQAEIDVCVAERRVQRDRLPVGLDRIVAFVESGQGSIGKLIYDPSLYNRVNATVAEFQGLVNDIAQANGSLGKLIEDDELYNKANASIDKINQLIDDINAGNGTVGKLLKDPTLYNNANQTVANIKHLTDDINAAAANEPGFVVRAAVYAVDVEGAIAAGAEIEELAWVDPRALPDLPFAPLTRDHVLPLALPTA